LVCIVANHKQQTQPATQATNNTSNKQHNANETKSLIGNLTLLFVFPVFFLISDWFDVLQSTQLSIIIPPPTASQHTMALRIAALRHTPTTTLLQRLAPRVSLLGGRAFTTRIPKAYRSSVEQYQHLVAAHTITHDAKQLALLQQLDDISHQIFQYKLDKLKHIAQLRQWERDVEQEAIRRVLEGERQERAKKPPSLKARATNMLQWLSATPAAQAPHNTLSSEPPIAMQEIENAAEKKQILMQTVREQWHDKKPQAPLPPRGAYIYGSVGTGKSLCMDLFYNSVSRFVPLHRRVHFHSVMLEAYQRMHRYTTRTRSNAAQNHHHDMLAEQLLHMPDNPLVGIATELLRFDHHAAATNDHCSLEGLTVKADASTSTSTSSTSTSSSSTSSSIPSLSDQSAVDEQVMLLCFDEFMANDVGDASILRGLLQVLWDHGAIVVMTSNRAPSELNKDGLQLSTWNTFTLRLEVHCKPIEMANPTDYRQWTIEREQQQSTPEQVCYEHLIVAPDRVSDQQVLQSEYLKSEYVKHQAQMLPIQRNVTLPVMFQRSFELPLLVSGIGCVDFEVCATISSECLVLSCGDCRRTTPTNVHHCCSRCIVHLWPCCWSDGLHCSVPKFAHSDSHQHSSNAYGRS
jgi:predicted ATPase